MKPVNQPSRANQRIVTDRHGNKRINLAYKDKSAPSKRVMTGASRPNTGDIDPRSVARSKDGSPIELYHGSSQRIEKFSDEFTGRGNDTWGSGFYMTTAKWAADSYGGETTRVHLDIRNPMRLDNKDGHINDAVEFSADESYEILKHHHDIMVQPTDEERFNPIGDFVPEFYSREHWSNNEMDKMIRRVADENLSDVPWSYVESIFRGEETAGFRRGVKSATGHDGVVVSMPDGEEHWVAWFPEQVIIQDDS